MRGDEYFETLGYTRLDSLSMPVWKMEGEIVQWPSSAAEEASNEIPSHDPTLVITLFNPYEYIIYTPLNVATLSERNHCY